MGDKVTTETVSTDLPGTIFEETERRTEADLNRGPSAYQHNALPLGQTGSPRIYIYEWYGNTTEADFVTACGKARCSDVLGPGLKENLT